MGNVYGLDTNTFQLVLDGLRVLVIITGLLALRSAILSERAFSRHYTGAMVGGILACITVISIRLITTDEAASMMDTAFLFEISLIAILYATAKYFDECKEKYNELSSKIKNSKESKKGK